MTSASLHSPKDYATHYSKDFGFSVFVIQNPEKRAEEEFLVEARKKPAVLWDVYQTMRPSQIQIERWFAKNANYNIAAVTGNISKIVAIDVDGPTAEKRIEEKMLEMSTNLRIALENTMINRTGSGGKHIIFKMDDPIEISQKVLWSNGEAHSQILLQGNSHYIVMPPSRHPNGAFYEWNGKTPNLLTKEELEEFIRLVGNSRISSIAASSSTTTSATTPTPGTSSSLSIEKMQELLNWIKPYYIKGNRDFIIFYISGLMRKDAGYPVENARTFVKLLHNATRDEEPLENRLTIVDNTYRKQLNELNGKSGLHDLLVTSYEGVGDNDEYLARCEAYSRICQIINGGSNNNNNNNNNISFNLDNNNNRSGAWLSRQKAADEHLNEVATLSEEVMRLNHFKALQDTREILWYHNGVYVPGGEERIKTLLVRLGGYDVTINVRREVMEQIIDRNKVDRSEFDKDIYLVNCKNCIIDLRSGKTLEHDPTYLFTQQLPVTYRPGQIKTCRKILDFLYNVMHPSDVPLILEFMAYCLIRDCRFQKALMCVGPPDSGKSTFLSLLTAFLGKENVANKTMQQLTENRFATASLFGKLANVFADLSSNRLRDIQMFKVLASGDSISAERKFRDTFDFEPFAKLVFSANLPPLPPDGISDEDAFYKRWFVKSFNLRKKCFFCGQKIEKDPNLLEKLITEEELSGLLYLVIKAAQRLLSRKRFAKSPTIEEIMEEYERKAKPVKAWVDARCITYQEYETEKDRLENDFEEYCQKKKLPGINRVHLGRDLKQYYSVEAVRRGPRNNQTHVWKGIALRKDLIAKGELDLDIYGNREEVEE